MGERAGWGEEGVSGVGWLVAAAGGGGVVASFCNVFACSFSNRNYIGPISTRLSLIDCSWNKVPSR